MDRIGAASAVDVAAIIASYSTSELKEAKVTIQKQAGSCAVDDLFTRSIRDGHGMTRILAMHRASSAESILRSGSVMANIGESDLNKKISLLVRFIPIINRVLSSRISTPPISPLSKTESDRADSPTKAAASSAESPRREDLIKVLLKI